MYRLYITSVKTKIKLDVSSLVSNIEHFTSIQGQPGKLSFVLEKDPNNLLILSHGDEVDFSIFDTEALVPKFYGIFKGKIFTLGTDSSEAYKVTAYDQTRYLKNKDTMAINAKPSDNWTLSNLFTEICQRNGLSKFMIKANNMTKLPSKMYADKSYFEILDENISEVLTESAGTQWLFVRDNYGVLELNELMATKTQYIIGDESLLTDYKFETSVDTETYNRIKIMADEADGSKTVLIVPKQDLKSINEIGVLQHLVNVPKGTTPAQGDKLATLYLQLYDKPTESINLSALGVPDLNAGDGFVLKLSKLHVMQYMFILSATHRYDADNHTMELEVSGFGSLKELQARTMNQLILETINGEWGNEAVRYQNFTELGFDAGEVQGEINDLYSEAENIKNGLYEGASVVDGKWTLTDKLKNKLSGDGFEPSLIETILNKKD